MSDLTYEQMKVLFENLQDRLDRTAGDKLSQEELERIRDILDKTQKNIAKQSAAAAKAADPRAIINEFFKQWRAQGPQSTNGGNRQTTGGTRTRRPPPSPPNNAGNTFIQRQLKARADAERDTARQITRSGKDRKKAEEGFQQALGTFNGTINKVASKLSGLTNNLGKGALGGVLGGVGGAIGGHLDDRADAYREMIAAGEGQFSSIDQMANAVNDAHISLNELAQAMKDSQGARMLGGASYTALTGALTKQTNEIGNMGLSFEQREEATQAYLEIAKSQGNIRNLDQQSMVEGIKSIVRSSEESANILGLTRSDVLKARKSQAADVNLANLLASKGIVGDKATAIYDESNTMKETFGELGEKLYKQILGDVAPSEDTAKLASTDPEAYRAIMTAANASKNGQSMSPQQLSSMLRAYGDRNFGSDLNALKARLALTGQNPLGEAGQASLGGAQRAKTLGTGVIPEKNGSQADNAELSIQEALRSGASAMRAGLDTMINTIKTEYGPELHKLVMGTIDMTNAIQDWLKVFQTMPEITSKFSIGLLGAIAAFGVLGGVVSTIVGAAVTIKSVATILAAPFKLFKGGGSAASASAGAGAGAGAAGAGAAGGTFIQRMLGRASGVAAGSGTKSILGGLGKGLGKNALMGSLFEGLGYLTGEKSFTMKNLAKSGMRVGGGALGGLLGSVAGPLGTFAGGTGGYMAGDWLANKIFGEDDRPQSSTDSKKGQQGVSQPQARQQSRAADATGQRNKQALTPDQISMRIMAAQELAVTHLKAMRDNSDTLNALIREEIQLTRTYGERTVRLLEDTSKNTRVIADNAA